MTLLDRLALVVPCYNEAARFDSSAFVHALGTYPWLDLLFVDDGSTDGTARLLDAIVIAWPTRVEVIAIRRNGGKAEAVRHGLSVAMNRAALCGFWDADLAAPLAEVATLRAILTSRLELEWIWGIRLRSLGRRIIRRATRHYLGRLFATCSALVLDIDSYDTQCGAKLFRSSPLLAAVLEQPFRSRWIFDIEMLTRAQQLLRYQGERTLAHVVYEQPLAEWTHHTGSKVKAIDFLRTFLELLTVRFARGRWYRPIA